MLGSESELILLLASRQFREAAEFAPASEMVKEFGER